ncbi:hypothetical protein [Streptomyces sp. BA2]|uniref:hypothetical protein n=1 Tax=Streptomyces sp. BA2 TaxID=436595 RepID=UPI0013255850|nr:hypothetical protein [Streptomyces sp. BA2]MWA10419.1 hypothetical protein [Streptomyces sp. BA2]
MNSGAGRIPSPPSPPPLPPAKRCNTVLRLYDAPLYRDWAAWTTAFMAVMTAFAIGTSEDPRGMPAWLDTSLATITFTVLFGVLPTWVRLWIRRRRWRTRDGGQRPVGRASLPPVQEVLAPVQEMQSPAREAEPRPRPRRAEPQPRKAEPPAAGSDRVAAVSQVMTHARQTVPHPVARAIRALQQADTPRDQYEAMLDAAESLALTACVTAAALLHKPGTDSGLGVLSTLRSAYLGAGTTFGTWTVGLDQVCATVTTAGHPRLLPAEFSSGVAGMVEDLKALKGERNRTAHGDKPLSQPEAALRVAECREFLERALGAAQFLEELPWLCVATCDYRQRTRTFQVVARNATGDHPVFERQTYEWDQPVAADAFYLLAPEGRVPLSPFATYTFCPQCRQTETCYASRVLKRESQATVKSFSRGHEIPVPELGDEIRALPARR